MGEGKYLQVETGKPIPKFGAAADGDADRNMILSSQLPGSALKDLGFRVTGYRFFIGFIWDWNQFHTGFT